MATDRARRTRLNQDIAIERMHLVHNNRYDYSKFIYLTVRTKSEIICRIHGSFFQTYSNHFFKRSGCPLCAYQATAERLKNTKRGYSNKLTQEVAIARAKQNHGNKFDYCMFEFVDIKSPGKIRCPDHGQFWMSILDHSKSKTGCPKCSKEVQRERFCFSFKEAIDRATQVHGNAYDYPEQKYINSITPITIVCHQHGSFKQSLDSHVHQMSGCPKCFGSSKRTKTEFIELAKTIHKERYDYSEVEYINNSTRVKITCFVHGTFWQIPRKHINGQGCPRCASNLNSERKWLARIGIPDDFKHRQVLLEGTQYVINGKIDNILYEFYSSYWYGDPRKYKPDDLNIKNGHYMGTLYLDALERQQKLKNLGYELKFIWEIDFRAGQLFSELNPHEN